MHFDRINQARSLAMLDLRGKPRQANLRRAVSSAYYAMFHFLVDESCRAIIGTKHSQRGFRQALARSFAHTTMKKACGIYGSAQLTGNIQKSLPKNLTGQYVIPKPIQRVSAVFRELQGVRHLADYDLSEYFRRSEVILLIDQAEDAIRDFASQPPSDDRHFFLVALLAWNDLTKH